jgi:hypothetical protein
MTFRRLRHVAAGTFHHHSRAFCHADMMLSPTAEFHPDDGPIRANYRYNAKTRISGSGVIGGVKASEAASGKSADIHGAAVKAVGGLTSRVAAPSVSRHGGERPSNVMGGGVIDPKPCGP